MEQAKRYTAQELQGTAFMLNDILRDRGVFLAQAEDMKKAHSWLAVVIDVLTDQSNYIDMANHGGGQSAFSFDPESQGFFKILLPAECRRDRQERSLWGDAVPNQFVFSRENELYVFESSSSPKRRRAVAEGDLETYERCP